MLPVRYALRATLSLLLVSCAHADQSVVPGEYRALVPHRLLPMLHTPEIHAELALSGEQVKELETLFATVDGPWFRARILPQDEQLATLDQLEQQVHAWLAKNATAQQQRRVRQLELQAQNLRSFLRSDVAAQMGISEQQQRKLADAARAAEKATATLQQAKLRGEAAADLERAAQAAIKAERSTAESMLSAMQRQQFGQLIGRPYDMSKLTRIYPMAPEFVEVDQWINSPPLTLAQLRGKVVLVHFYAFQCHNCHANFEIYRRWHEQLREKGVVVIGIQTPETARERDPQAVRAAAAEKNLQFPILIDLQSENWNAWANTMWPTVYVVDKHGYLRHWWQGELNWQGATGDKLIEQVVATALGED